MIFVRRSFHVLSVPAGLLLVLSIAAVADASIITVLTPSSSTLGGQPVDASVKFTLAANQVVITLTNLQENPKGVSQNLSDLEFSIDTGQTAGTIVSDSAILRTVAGNGSYTDGGSVSAGWALLADGDRIVLDVLDAAAGPARTIIGPPGGATYSNANSSIAGNGPHNPFLDQSVTWTLNVPGVTGDSSITAVTFSFGTSEGSDISVTLPPTGTGAPEPATMGLLAAGGMLWFARRRRVAG